MELREVADLFDGVRMNGRGFQAKCPAHDDTHPSLTVTQGKTGWLVSCHVGCSFFDITRALDVSPIVFKFGGTSATSALGSPLDARRKLGSMIRESRRIPYRFIDLAEIALGVRHQRVVQVEERWAHIVDDPMPVAMKMWHVTMDGVVWDLIGGQYQKFGVDWVEAKQTITQLLWQTYRTERAELMEET